VTAPARQQGAGSNPIPELLIRQVLREGYHEAIEDDALLADIFRRADDLPQGTHDQWLEDMKASFRSMVIGGQIGMDVGYPDDVANLPYIGIVLEGGSEDESQAAFGDVLGRDYELVGDPANVDPASGEFAKLYEHTTIGCEETTTVQVSAWSLAPEDSLLLHAINRALLMRHKRRLEDAGINDITFSDSGFVPGQHPFEGRVGFVPMTRCTMRWTRRQTLVEGPVPRFFRIMTPTFSN
jgi:hypothetical protein